MFELSSEYASAYFMAKTLYIPLAKGVLWGKNWENRGMNICQCLVKLPLTNYCFYQKSVYIDSLIKKIKWLKFLLTSPLEANNWTHLMLSKGPLYLIQFKIQK